VLSRTILRLIPFVAAASWLGLFPGSAAAQDVPGAPAASAPTQAEAPVVPNPGDVAIEVESFGVGNMVRPGDWAGIRLLLQDTGDRNREVAVRLHLPDSDGDTAQYTRVVVLNPARRLGVWLYARMPWTITPGSPVRVSLAEASPARNGGLTIGRQIGWRPVAPLTVSRPEDSLALVVGGSSLGLDQFSQVLRNRDIPPAAHERVQVVGGVSPDMLPDHWTGLSAFDVLLWSGEDPAGLQGEAPQAIREWVHRGGHFVIVLPAVGAEWTSASNPLADLMPACKIDRLAEVDLEPYRMILSGQRVPGETIKSPIHRFTIAAATPESEATPILTGPHGVVAVRRLAGAGMVTVIGIDLSDRRLAHEGWLRGDAVWARILGRRGGTPTAAEVESLTKGIPRSVGADLWVDDRIGALISQSRKASVGVFFALILFLLYIAVAGPIGFKALQFKGLVRHSWVAFVATAGVFTAMAWAAATSLRPRREEAWHFTLLDHVYGQSVQRARSYVSVLLPTYGEQRVSLGEAGLDERWSQALTPWGDPAADSSPAFPDARPYDAESRRLTELTVPARSTVRTFQADWLGGPRWSMPVPATPEAAPRMDSTGRLVGTVRHSLPGPLEQARVILITGQVSENSLGRTTGVSPQPVGRAYGWVLRDPWQAGQPLDLSQFQPAPPALLAKRLAELVPQVSRVQLGNVVASKDEDLDDMTALYGVLEQPEINKTFTTGPASVHRRMTHGFDLAKWFTQPCIIILGRIEGAPNPVPLAVDGHPLDGVDRPSSGRTIVRWIYPLAPAPLVVGGRTIPDPASVAPEPRKPS
jgi:hypothetical protein